MTLLGPFRDRVHTLTLDKGTEGAEPERIAQSLGAAVYFAYPDHSWERGTNENTQGRDRQYFSKHRDLSTVTRKELDHATERLNHCPRKRLDFRTPMRYASIPELHSRLHFQLEPANAYKNCGSFISYFFCSSFSLGWVYHDPGNQAARWES